MKSEELKKRKSKSCERCHHSVFVPKRFVEVYPLFPVQEIMRGFQTINIFFYFKFSLNSSNNNMNSIYTQLLKNHNGFTGNFIGTKDS